MKFISRVKNTIFVGTVAGIALLQCSSLAYAASTDLADSPLAVRNGAKPNIMFILDNSGSMEWRSITGLDALDEYDDTKIDFYSPLVNQVYYDPNTRYLPGIVKDSFTALVPEGTSMPNADTTSTGALVDPYLSPTGTRTDLTKSCYYSTASAPYQPTSSNCRSDDSTYKFGPIAYTAYYYNYTGAGTPTPGSSTSYDRKDILSSNAPFTRGSKRTDCSVSGSTATCTYAQEIQNFANWYSYYRTRILTMKTSMGLAFSRLGSRYRVGFSTINNSSSTGNSTGANFKAIADFNDATKIAWFTQLYAINPANGTPLQKALRRVGEYYSGNGMGYSNSVGADQPVQHACQSNYAILSTDGFWNSLSTNSVSVGDADSTVPTVPSSGLSPVPTTGLTAGANWPRPFYEGPTASSNSVADVAAYYWVTDLSALTNIVPVSTADPASWQHMVTFTIGLGADGSKDYKENYLTSTASTDFYNMVKAGTDNWPVPVADTNTAIDDLWHAAVNGHGQYFSAKSPSVLISSLQRVLDDIISRDGAAAAVAISSINLHVDNSLFASGYNSGNWSGDLERYAVSVTTGVPSTTADWSAKTLLDAASVTPSTRRIVTHTGLAGNGQGIQFQPDSATIAGLILTKISTTQQSALNSAISPPGPSDGEDVLAFIRGDTSKEGTVYRDRASRLGDIINAEAVVVGTPLYSYGDQGYAAFKLAQSTTIASPSRVKTVFQGANDGMLHAFKASDGQENWAYIPSFFFSGTSKLRDLSKLTAFSHQYFVDATPGVGDADFWKTSGSTLTSPDWRTVLVGALGKGGRGYYALDVTTPTVSSEAAAAGKVLWEFPNAGTSGSVTVTTTSGTTTNGLTMAVNKLGYTYGTPVITKTRAHGWVALVASGYNNGSDSGGDGHGYLFVLNLKTGALLHVFDTGVGSSSDPSGLAHISAFVDNGMVDNTVEYVYGGDLSGNVWRFDLSDASVSNWKVKKLATLVDGSTATQSVTTAPELARIVVGGITKRFVYVGTGQYLGDSDIPGVGANSHASQTQTIYGLVDDLTNPSGATAVITPLRTSLQAQTMTSSGSTRSVTSNAVNFSTKKGWYVDLPVSGERVNTNPVISLGALIFTSNIPTSDVCTPGGSSWLNMLDYKTGGTLSGVTTPFVFLGNVLSSRPSVVTYGTESGVITQGSNGSLNKNAGPSTRAPTSSRRVSWREITEE